MLPSLLALTIGLGIGLLAQKQLLAILIAVAIPGLYWLIRAISTRLATSSHIDSVTLPASIFKSEYDNIKFIDDQTKARKHQAFSTAISYIAGMGVGLLATPLLTVT